MGSRPRSNPRRGVIRAVITVIVLTALLIIAILVVSSLSAPSAKAPTTPLTPGPITPVTAATPATTPSTKTPVSVTPSVQPSPTAKKKTLGSRLARRPLFSGLERAPSGSLLRHAATWNSSGIVMRSHNRVAYFTPVDRRASVGSLRIRFLASGRTVLLGRANPLFKPVWSDSGRFLLYVDSSPSSTYPGAEWTLRQYDVQRHSSAQLASASGIAMTPLGWWHARPLILVATGSDTSLYSVHAGRVRFLAVLAPQVVTSAALSPTAAIVAFAAPTNCYNCTLDFFDLRTLSEWDGPSGIANESRIVWSDDGRHIVTVLQGSVAVVPAVPDGRTALAGQVTLPTVWLHSMNASLRPSGVRVIDSVTDHSVFTAYRAGTS